MTYKQLVDSIKTVTEKHYMIADFGYGQVSDIKNSGDQTEADYPYAFMIPAAHTRAERSITYRFNLIMMEMVLDGDYLTTQSNCQQYLDDIIAELKLGDLQLDTNINVSLTPFKERFQDEVAGMTAFLEIEIPEALNLCIAPIEPVIPPIPSCDPVISNVLTNDVVKDPDLGTSPLSFDDKVLEDSDYGSMGTSFFSNALLGTYRFVIEGNYQFEEPAAGESMPSVPVVVVSGQPSNTDAIEVIGWPEQWPGDQPVQVKLTYDVDLSNSTTLSFAVVLDDPTVQESAFTQKAGGTISICTDLVPVDPVIYDTSYDGDYEWFNSIPFVENYVGGYINSAPNVRNTDYIPVSGGTNFELAQPATVNIRWTATVQNAIDQAVIDAQDPAVLNNPVPQMYLYDITNQEVVAGTVDLWDNTQTIGQEFQIENEFTLSLPAGNYSYTYAGNPYNFATGSDQALFKQMSFTITLA